MWKDPFCKKCSMQNLNDEAFTKKLCQKTKWNSRLQTEKLTQNLHDISHFINLKLKLRCLCVIHSTQDREISPTSGGKKIADSAILYLSAISSYLWLYIRAFRPIKSNILCTLLSGHFWRDRENCDLVKTEKLQKIHLEEEKTVNSTTQDEGITRGHFLWLTPIALYI